MIKKKVFLRADGNSTIGMGHIYRQIAISEILNSVFDCIFILYRPDSSLTNLIAKLHLTNIILTEVDLNLRPKQVDIFENDILVLDGYQFDYDYQVTVKEFYNCKLVCVDDIFSTRFVADLVINHAGSIDKQMYDLSENTEILLGPRYAILRGDFYFSQNVKKVLHPIKSVFINFGGADLDNNTCKVLEILKDLNLQFNVVTGSAYLYNAQIKSIADSLDNITLYTNITTKEIINVMQNSDAAICSASTVAYEYCSVGGVLFLLKTADNQKYVEKFLLSQGLAFQLSDFQKIIEDNNILDIVNKQISIQKYTFDGLAGDRILDSFKKLYYKSSITIRKALPSDVDQYFEWANDPEVRKNSFSSDTISYENHCKWFNANLQSQSSYFYLYTKTDNAAVGTTRFKVTKTEAIISYLVDSKFRGMGIGKMLLQKGTALFFKECILATEVIALVQSSNISSQKILIAAGYAVDKIAEDVITFKIYRSDKRY